MFVYRTQACGEYLDVAKTQVKRLQKIVNYEHEQRMKLEEMVEQLAKEQVTLESKAKKSMGHALTKKGTDYHSSVAVLSHLSLSPLSVVIVKFSHFDLLQNHSANYNQTLHKTSLGQGNSICSNEGQHSF
mgnify:CR=1 FL=1